MLCCEEVVQCCDTMLCCEKGPVHCETVHCVVKKKQCFVEECIVLCCEEVVDCGSVHCAVL